MNLYKLGVPTRNTPPSKTRNLFGPRLKEIRLGRGMSAVALIAKLEINGWSLLPSSLSDLEAGRRSLTDVELMLLLKVLRADLSDLIPRKEG